MPLPYSQAMIECKRGTPGLSRIKSPLNAAFALADTKLPAAVFAQAPSPGSTDAASAAASSAPSAAQSVRPSNKRPLPENPKLTQFELAIVASIANDLSNPASVTSCHAIAVTLARCLSAHGGSIKLNRQPPTQDAARTAAADETFLRTVCRFLIGAPEACVRVRTEYHSFVLVVHNGKVDSIEAWANRDRPLTLDKCVSGQFPEQTRDQLLAAIPDFLNSDDATRNAAFNKFSRAGRDGTPYFTQAAVTRLDFEITPLKDLNQFREAVSELLGACANLKKAVEMYKLEIAGLRPAPEPAKRPNTRSLPAASTNSQ